MEHLQRSQQQWSTSSSQGRTSDLIGGCSATPSRMGASTRERRDLTGLADTLDELVPARPRRRRRRGGGDRGRESARVVVVRPERSLASRSGGRVARSSTSSTTRASSVTASASSATARSTTRASCPPEGFVHPEAAGRGIGRLIATGLEAVAARRGARRIQSNVIERDAGAHMLLESLGYRDVRVFRELRIEPAARLPAPEWPDGLRVVAVRPGPGRARIPRRASGGVPGSTGSTRRATSSRGQRATSRASASIPRSGASYGRGTKSPPGRSAPATRTAAASSTSSSRAARGAGGA